MKQQTKLARLITLYRSLNTLSAQQVGDEIGVSAKIIHQIEKSQEIKTVNLIKVMTWLTATKEEEVLNVNESTENFAIPGDSIENNDPPLTN